MKDRLVDDIADYLDQDSALWYADRGIPYRRGYLLHGRPGCGKTSFAMAVAGEFKMNIYTVSLLERTVTDYTLLDLFQKIPAGSLVLMEDIDCAGLGRKYVDAQKEEEMPVSTKAKPSPEHKDDPSDSDLSSDSSDDDALVDPVKSTRSAKLKAKKKAKAKKRYQRRKEKEGRKNKGEEQKAQPARVAPPAPSQVTLSGLLNAIDGASAPQGHLLIMTSNKPEELDEALIRPGRVDMYVEFEYASHDQIRDMFMKMYKPSRSDKKSSFDLSTVDPLAKAFAGRVPAAEFSPAQIQQYLIPHRTRPQDAVDGIEKWVAENMYAKTATSASQAELGGEYVKVEPKASGVSRLFHGGTQRGSDQASAFKQRLDS